MQALYALQCFVIALSLWIGNGGGSGSVGGNDSLRDFFLARNQIYSCTVDGKSAYVVSDDYDDSKDTVLSNSQAAHDDTQAARNNSQAACNDNTLSASNAARLYVDNGELFVDPIPVILQTKNDRVFISGAGIELQPCDLEPLPQEPTMAAGMLPRDFYKPRYAVSVQRDVVYAHASGYWTSYPDTFEDFGTIFKRKLVNGELLFRRYLPLEMDVYQPDDGAPADFKRPLMVMIHGGGFYNGDKADVEYRKWCMMFAECGYTTVSINYRLGFTPLKGNVGRAAYRAVQDARAAICFLLKHQDDYHIDRDRIFLAGCSAGAITALNAAYMDTASRPEGCSSAAFGFDGDLGVIDQVALDEGIYEDFTVRAVGNMWGGVFDLGILDRPDGARIYSIQSIYDPVVPANTDYPFKVIYGKSVLLQPFLEFLTPKINGSLKIESLHRKGDRFLYFAEDRHTLIRYPSDDHSLNERHKMFFGCLTEFFRDNMLNAPSRLVNRSDDKQRFTVVPADELKALSWQVKGGVITSREGFGEARALFFSDARRHSVIVDGMYKFGLEYKDTLEVR